MKKPATAYVCASCGHAEPKWLGRCPECGQWNTLRERAAGALPGGRSGRDEGGESFSLPLAAIDPSSGTRIGSGSAELDRVLGGGFMRGSVALLGGEPGIGKSTLLLQVGARLGAAGRVLYVSGEESPAQIRLRADRLGLSREGLEVLCSPDLERIRAVLDDVMYFGDHLRLRCQMPEQPEMSVKVPLQHLGHMQAGQSVHLHLPPSHLRIYL